MLGWHSQETLDPIAQHHSGPKQEDLVISGELGCPGAPRPVFSPQPPAPPSWHPQDTLDPITQSQPGLKQEDLVIMG